MVAAADSHSPAMAYLKPSHAQPVQLLAHCPLFRVILAFAMLFSCARPVVARCFTAPPLRSGSVDVPPDHPQNWIVRGTESLVNDNWGGQGSVSVHNNGGVVLGHRGIT